MVILFVVLVLHVDADSLSHDVPTSRECFAPREVSTEASTVSDVEATPGTPASAVADTYKHLKFLWKEEMGKEINIECQWLMVSQFQWNLKVNTFAPSLIPVEISSIVLLFTVELDFLELEIPERK